MFLRGEEKKILDSETLAYHPLPWCESRGCKNVKKKKNHLKKTEEEENNMHTKRQRQQVCALQIRALGALCRLLSQV